MTSDVSVDVDTATEVRACFEAYEAALVAGDVTAMNGWFRDDAHTIRFGIADEQWGSEAISQWRSAAAPVPAGRELSGTDVVVWSPDLAVITTLFRYPASPALGRQSQTWLRGPDGWQIVHAHVSQRLEV